MKAYLITVIFKDGSKEGVLFTDEKDVIYAMTGNDSGMSGVSSLADYWRDFIHDNNHVAPIKTEIEI